MNDYMNDINNIDDSGQLTLFAATEDSVEDLIYEFLKDRGASTERVYHRDLKQAEANPSSQPNIQSKFLLRIPNGPSEVTEGLAADKSLGWDFNLVILTEGKGLFPRNNAQVRALFCL